MSTAPVPLRAATVAGAVLAVIFIVLSAAVSWVNISRTQAAHSFDEQAAQAQSDKAALDQEIKAAKTRLDAVGVVRDASTWCDSISRSNASTIRDAIKTYDSATQSLKETIHAQCPDKETLANAQRTLSNADFTIAITECTTDQVTTTVNGTLTIKPSSTITTFGPLDVTVIGYTTEKNTTLNPSSPYQGNATATLTPGTTARLHGLSSLRPANDGQYRVRGHDDRVVALKHVTLARPVAHQSPPFQPSRDGGNHERSFP